MKWTEERKEEEILLEKGNQIRQYHADVVNLCEVPDEDVHQDESCRTCHICSRGPFQTTPIIRDLLLFC